MSGVRTWHTAYTLPDTHRFCGFCDRPLEHFTSPFLVPGNFKAPGYSALLCDPCAQEWARRENEAQRQMEAWHEAGCPT